MDRALENQQLAVNAKCHGTAAARTPGGVAASTVSFEPRESALAKVADGIHRPDKSRGRTPRPRQKSAAPSANPTKVATSDDIIPGTSL